MESSYFFHLRPVFIPLWARVILLTSHHQAVDWAATSQMLSDTHTYKELCVWVEEVGVIDRLLLFPFVGELDYCGGIIILIKELLAQIIFHLVP